MDHQAYRADVARPRPQPGTQVNAEQWHRKVSRPARKTARPARPPGLQDRPAPKTAARANRRTAGPDYDVAPGND
jgi:hypothetical protein